MREWKTKRTSIRRRVIEITELLWRESENAVWGATLMRPWLSEGEGARTERWKWKRGYVEFLVRSEWRLMCPCAMPHSGATNSNNSGKVLYDGNASEKMWEKLVDECLFLEADNVVCRLRARGHFSVSAKSIRWLSNWIIGFAPLALAATI